ncbi:alpha/beta hydrolase [Porticoccaceae bacterium]|nr:alpha/beta hydrolase [Porticoccaceae bacterium]
MRHLVFVCIAIGSMIFLNATKVQAEFNPADFPKPSIVSVNGIKLEVFEAGKENAGNPIVLCHGWPEHAFSWRYQIPALVSAGYHVIVPNQRGFGNSSRPTEVSDYDITYLTGDLVALLDHYGYKDAVFMGHDWGANIVWSMALLHPERVSKLINLALPYQVLGDTPWIEMLEGMFGPDYYMVHFSRQPGVADKIFADNTARFIGNVYRKNVAPPEPWMSLISQATAETPLGDPLMSDEELNVYISAYETSGFTGGINYYRNINRNWHVMGDVDPIIQTPALMIYGDRDVIPKMANLADYVPNVDVISLDAGHSIQQERPEETNQAILKWLKHQAAK